jgi:transposase-like protein
MKQADAKFEMPIAAQEPARVSRRTYSQQFKREVVAQCLVPGASVSAVAMSHRINANVVRKWLPRYCERPGAAPTKMVPVSISPTGLTEIQSGLPAATAPRTPIELILIDATVRLPAGFDPAELHCIVQILAALR